MLHGSFRPDRSLWAHRWLLALAVAGFWLTPLSLAEAADAAALQAAQARLLSGKYAEAAEEFAALAGDWPVEAAVGHARCETAEGQYEQAAQRLRQTLEALEADDKQAAPLHAELAHLAFLRGDYVSSRKHVDAALAADGNQLQARWFDGELHRVAGRLEQADQAYEWLVDYYNAHDIDQAESLRWIGLGASQFARWNRLHDQFRFLVNNLYPEALKLNDRYWPAYYESALLYLEKFNQSETRKDLEAALARNPNSAEVYAAVAALALQTYDLDDARRALDRAAAINPKLLQLYWYRADAHLANFETHEAVDVLEAAVKLNPVAEETLGRLAAAYAVVDGVPDDPAGTRMGKIIDEATARNPHAGEFFHALAAALDQTRRFPAAARYYREAVERMPQLIAPKGALGLMYMRLGEEPEARRLLEESFDADPFNVRVSNSLKVLDVLDDYAVVESEHFVIKFDRQQDEILVRYMLRYLEEEVYPELTAHFGFEPEGKSLFEIFNRARNTGGHGWFSARMVGLPYIGTVGACAGKIVALASPNDMPKKYNWARVLKHEFVHVLNLQQSNFNIPHWYTEALAVQSEGYPRPQVWNQLLRQRVPKGELFDLDTINLGFVRPNSSIDWQMAYCQAQLYAQYMLATYGDDALAKMLNCYADNLTTREALRRSFDVEQEDFEVGYLKYLEEIVAELGTAAEGEKEMSLAQLVRAHQESPDDPDLAARLAQAHLAGEQYPQARRLAEQVLEEHPGHQRATYVLARIRLLVGDNDEAEQLLIDCLDAERPDMQVLNLLAGMRMKAKNYAGAAELYLLAAERDPTNVQWTRSLAQVYLLEQDLAKLTPVLVKLAEQDGDEFLIRKKLAQLALARRDYDDAIRWGNEALWIDVMDYQVHAMLAEAYEATENHLRAAEEYDVMTRLDPKRVDAQVNLVRAWVHAERRDKAAAALDELRRRDPQNAELPALEKLVQP